MNRRVENTEGCIREFNPRDPVTVDTFFPEAEDYSEDYSSDYSDYSEDHSENYSEDDVSNEDDLESDHPGRFHGGHGGYGGYGGLGFGAGLLGGALLASAINPYPYAYPYPYYTGY